LFEVTHGTAVDVIHLDELADNGEQNEDDHEKWGCSQPIVNSEPEPEKHDDTAGKFHPMRNTSIQGDRRFGLRK
jgi:hypothetical protein